MKRILINATHNEEIRVALCKDSHLYDFDLENRTREQKKANIYKGHVTRVEPSLEAVFVEYGSARQGFLPLREIAPEYLKGNPRTDNVRDLIKEGDEVIIQIEKEERGNKGAAVSTYISLAGRYLVLMPNNPKGGGISRQISGKVREEMKQIISSLSIPKGMSVIVRTAGIGRGFDDLQNDLSHLLDIWASILEQNRTRPSPCLVHQEAGVVTRAVRDYLRDDIGEVWIDSENAYNEAAHFIASVMPNQMGKLRKYTDYEPLFTRFGVERQIETAYQREVRLPSGGSIVIDQTEAMVAIDINSAKSTKGSDVAETAYHTNLEAADEIARQLRLRDMGGLIVIDFIDMADARHQKDVEKRLIDATRYDRARVQFAEISKFGLMEMSRQRLRPSLDEATGYICPRCHGNGMIRDLRSLALSIMRQIEQIALKERIGEIQAEVPTEIAAFLLNEKRESLVYLEQDSGVRITILPHAHLESPNFSLHFNPDGFAPSSYDRIVDVEEREAGDRGYEVNWQTKTDEPNTNANRWQKAENANLAKSKESTKDKVTAKEPTQEVKAVAWLSNLFAPKPQARLAPSLNNEDAAAAIESMINDGRVSLGSFGLLNIPEAKTEEKINDKVSEKTERSARPERDDKHKRKPKRDLADGEVKIEKNEKRDHQSLEKEKTDKTERRKKELDYPKREAHSQREPRGEVVRGETLKPVDKPTAQKADNQETVNLSESKAELKPNKATDKTDKAPKAHKAGESKADKAKTERAVGKHTNPNEVMVHVSPIAHTEMRGEPVHLSLDNSKPKSPDTDIAQASHDDLNKVEAVDDLVVPTLRDDHQVIQSEVPATAETQQAPDAPIADDVAQPAPAVTATETRTTLNAERLSALAVQMNKAINDPRVVAVALREQLSISTHHADSERKHQSANASITGSAGQFIVRTLGEELSADWREHFVATFLLAMKKFTAQLEKQPSDSTAQPDSADLTHEFAKTFANYGYAPLSQDYLTQFQENTNALSRWHVAQGKTHAEPRPATERASNDPRGQHPAFDDVKSTPINESATMATEIPEISEHLNDTDNTQVITADHDDGVPLELASSESVSQTANNAPDSAESILKSLIETLDDIMSAYDEPQASPTKPQKDVSKDGDKNSKSKGKSSPASYKDMIESVSGQLLQPTGILNLVTPKKPKVTKPKTPKPPKTPAKRTSKAAQKAEVVKRPKSGADAIENVDQLSVNDSSS